MHNSETTKRPGFELAENLLKACNDRDLKSALGLLHEAARDHLFTPLDKIPFDKEKGLLHALVENPLLYFPDGSVTVAVRHVATWAQAYVRRHARRHGYKIVGEAPVAMEIEGDTLTIRLPVYTEVVFNVASLREPR